MSTETYVIHTAPTDPDEYSPRAVYDPTGPNGQPIPTSTDHRWLWHIESVLAVNAPMGSHLDVMRRSLRTYLNGNCQHHWSYSDAEGDFEAMRQCLWCCVVHLAADAEYVPDSPAAGVGEDPE